MSVRGAASTRRTQATRVSTHVSTSILESRLKLSGVLRSRGALYVHRLFDHLQPIFWIHTIQGQSDITFTYSNNARRMSRVLSCAMSFRYILKYNIKLLTKAGNTSF